MKIVAVYNIKGGVGKTATSVNLAYQAAKGSKRTLIWDLDPQGSTSFYLRVKAKVKGGGKALLAGKTKIAKAIDETDVEYLDVLPADFSYRKLDLMLDKLDKPKKHFRRLLDPIRDDYDWVFLDCPPGLSRLTDAVLAASSLVLIPTIPTTLSMRTLARIIRYVKDGPPLRAFISMLDRRRTLQRDIYAQSLKRPHLFFQTAIPNSTIVEQMGVRRQPIGAFAASSGVAKLYAQLWREIQKTVPAV